MSYRITIKDDNLPDYEPVIGIPDRVAEEVRNDDDKAISFARAIVAKYEKTEGGLYRTLGHHKFFNDSMTTTDQSMKEILADQSLHGTYEPHTTKLIESLVKEGMVCLDVGASIGYFTLLLARQVGSTGVVYAVEPTKNQFPYLVRNIEANGYTNVQAWNIAASDSFEKAKLNTNAAQVDLVDAVPLDSCFKEEQKLDFIKIDVDGSEPRVLRGLEETIQRSPKLKMVIEFYPKYIERLGLNPQDVLDFLNQYFTYEKIEGDYGQEYWNYFCVRK